MDTPAREHRGAVSCLFGVASESDADQPSVGFAGTLPGVREELERQVSGFIALAPVAL